MLNKIEQWIDQTNMDYEAQRITCDRFTKEFNGFYPASFLKGAYFVVVNEIPKPDFPELREMGLGDFIDMRVDAITYKNTYYILPHAAHDLRLHFHELVHVVQWGHLRPANFIKRYIEEIQCYGYCAAPLEKMAYRLDTHYANGEEKLDVPSYVSDKI